MFISVWKCFYNVLFSLPQNVCALQVQVCQGLLDSSGWWDPHQLAGLEEGAGKDIVQSDVIIRNAETDRGEFLYKLDYIS